MLVMIDLALLQDRAFVEVQKLLSGVKCKKDKEPDCRSG